MADYYAAAAVLAVREPKQLLPKAEWAATRALEMDPLECGAHASLSVVQAIYYSRWDLAAGHFYRVLEDESHFQPYLFVLAPGLPEAPKGSAPGALVYRAAAQYLTGDSFGATGWPEMPPKQIRHFGQPYTCRLLLTARQNLPPYCGRMVFLLAAVLNRPNP